MVPQKVLDTELKKSFAHFNEGRIPVSALSAGKHVDLTHNHSLTKSAVGTVFNVSYLLKLTHYILTVLHEKTNQ